MSFKGASDKEQARLRRPTPNRFGNFGMTPSQQELAENLKARLKQLVKKLEGIHVPQQKVDIKAEITAINRQLAELKPKKKYGQDFTNYICDVIKKEVTQAQWKIWVAKAEKLFQETQCQNQKSESTSPNPED